MNDENPWSDAVRKFISSLRYKDRSGHTEDHYERDLGAFSAWWAETSPKEPLTPGSITDTDVRAWRDYLRTTPLDDAGRVRKPASVNARMSALKSFLFWAKSAKVIGSLPETPRREKLGVQAVKALDKKKQQELLRRAARDKNPRNLALVAVLLETGLRVAELVALRWKDVPFTERKGTVKVTEGKGRKPRDIPMSPGARRAFQSLREAKPAAGPTDPVFASQRKGEGLSARGVQEVLARLGEDLGWEEPLHPHLLRHSFAINLKLRKIDWPEIAKLMGHTSVVTSMTHYGTPSERDLRKALDPDGDD